jgi:hypothetical protein
VAAIPVGPHHFRSALKIRRPLASAIAVRDLDLQVQMVAAIRIFFLQSMALGLDHAQERLDGIRIGAPTGDHQRCALPYTRRRAFF